MSTHGCFPPLFPPLSILLRRGNQCGAQEPDDTTDDYYFPEGAYYYVQAADDDQE